jgi:DNA-binding transcriptional LysR family regulator
VAQMWSRIGVRVDLQAMPSNVYFSRSARSEFPVGLSGWGTGTGEPDHPMVALIATPNAATGRGASNRSLYSSPAFDALLDKALVTIDPPAREEIYRQATPLLFESTTLAIQAAMEGLGIVICSTAFVGDELRTGRLASLPGRSLMTGDCYWLILPQGRIGAPLRIFADWLAREAAAESATTHDGAAGG